MLDLDPWDRSMLCAPLASVILRNFGEVTRQTWPWPGNNYLQPRLVAFALLAIKTLNIS